MNNLSASRKWIATFAVFFYGLSFVKTGYSIYQENQSIHVALVRWLNDPSLFPGDPFAETLKYYASPLWRLVASAARFIALEKLLLILFLLERALVIGAAGYLARTLFPGSRWAAVFAMALLALTIQPLVGAGTIVLPFFEQTGLAVAFFMLTAAFFYKNKPYLTAAGMGVIFNLNILYGFFAISYFLPSFLADPEHRASWKRWIAPSALFLALSVPAIWMALSALGIKPADEREWITALYNFYPDHFYPEMWRKIRIFLLGFLALFSTAVFWAEKETHPRIFKWNAVWLGVSGAWLGLAFLSAYAAPSPSFLIIHPARATDLWYCFCGISLTGVLSSSLERAAKSANRFFLIFLLFLSLGLWIPGAAEPFVQAGERVVLRRPFVKAPPADVMRIAAWAKDRAPAESHFLVDPSWDSFRAMSMRGNFVLWFDGSAILWDKAFAKTWIERLRAIGYDTETRTARPYPETRAKLSRIVEEMNDADAARLKKEYPSLRYWVVRENKSSAFPEAYRSGNYKVLEIT